MSSKRKQKLRERMRHAARKRTFRTAEGVAAYLHGNGRLAVVFQLDEMGGICSNAVITHGSEALGIVPVPMLTQIAAQVPSLDTVELRRTIATYQAEQAGLGGHA